MALSKKDILAAKDLNTREVEVPEWGGSILIQQLSGLQIEEYQKLLSENEGFSSAWLLASLAIVDDNGEQLFGVDEVDLLAKKNYKVLERIIGEVNKVNGVSEESVEQAEKN